MNGYIGMLKDLDITQDQMDYVTNHQTTIEFESDVYHKSESKIHGIGVFALRKILKEETIGLGSIDCKHKTILGRYTNHSDDNNAMFYYLKTNDVVMIAERNIDKGEEILINYRDHVLNEKYL
jgi:SET domain-containing protein